MNKSIEFIEDTTKCIMCGIQKRKIMTSKNFFRYSGKATCDDEICKTQYLSFSSRNRKILKNYGFIKIIKRTINKEPNPVFENMSTLCKCCGKTFGKNNPHEVKQGVRFDFLCKTCEDLESYSCNKLNWII